MNEIELKTHVSEEIHDDFLVLARILGYANKAEFLRMIVTREVFGMMPQIQNNAPKYSSLVRKQGEQGAGK